MSQFVYLLNCELAEIYFIEKRMFNYEYSQHTSIYLLDVLLLQIQRSVLEKRDAKEATVFSSLWPLVADKDMEISAFGLRELLAAVFTKNISSLAFCIFVGDIWQNDGIYGHMFPLAAEKLKLKAKVDQQARFQSLLSKLGIQIWDRKYVYF